MQTGGADPFYRSILAAGHQRYVRVEVWSGLGEPLAELIPAELSGDPEGGLVFLPGSHVSGTLTSQVARNLTLQVPARLYPARETDLLAPYGNEIRAFAGIALPGSTKYVWPVFRGKIQDAIENDDGGTVSIPCSDRSQEVLDADFVTPQNSNVGSSLMSEYQRLVQDVVRNAEFGPSDDFTTAVKPLSWEFDRGSALEEMFSSVGALWYTLPDGRFVARKYPWANPGAPVVTLRDGEGGEILAANRRRSRSGVHNVITLTGERLNGDKPVTATRSDDNPTSITYVGGGFGVRSKLLRKQTPSTDGGAQHGAEQALRTAITPTEQWSWQQVPDAAAELGDICLLEAKGVAVVQVVQSFSFPLDLSGPMTVQGRSQVVGLVESSGGV